ncbi:23S rRNA (pseudouridine(1915)-N(3))-methyltransferase RlmH [Psychroflexus lacisalsi]|jgi:23S rRNA (pseudouridine1915-N3)-methyltransferase|uniref:Ribosomal RNA large subunit methyltransferase H n=1 Tax=Psychroflexus lacisalsi TaxID=503928 RepID=A0ABN1K7C6_9FLAO|nr:23S rRNA (pseudouridine(1915)-N(3))-methyltransferase RlmH [Psychroflexus lacisalsi]MBZ9619461.1 23S rRNA (pseudouridine(1915)-N(3))-methyltransferase RlmH [Psychroflexus lacisalsi]
MTISLVLVGKTDNKHLEALINDYKKRLSFFVKFEVTIIPDLKKRKNMETEVQKEKEGELILSKISNSDFVVLLDENGVDHSSTKFASWLQKRMNSGIKKLVFVIGGPYGFSKPVYDRGNRILSLSKMTFSHQMIRLFFTEQLYRAFSILKNLPYHHE